MKKRITVLLLILGLAFAATASQAQDSPRETLKANLGTIIDVLKDPDFDTTDGVSQAHLDALRDAVFSFFDFRELTRRAVGQPWKSFTEEQRVELTNTFQKLLELTYLKKLNNEFLKELDSFSEDSILYLDEKVKGDLAMVHTKFNLTDSEIAVDFRLIKKDKWWVYDIIGEGLTLLGIYKDDFRNALVNKTPDELIQILKDRIKAIEEGKEEGTE